jgi:ribulose-phosphate 3-epimerase
MKTLVVPAIITNSQEELDRMLEVVKGRVKRVQLDIMDGNFVPNNSLLFDFKLPNYFEYEAHLMVEKPLKWVEKNGEKVDVITFHIETLMDVDKAIAYVKKKGKKVNLALIPTTDFDIVEKYLKKIDGILIMTVDPGSYCMNKNFNPQPLKKIEAIREKDKEITIEVDGCMNPQNIKLTERSGANIFASGSYIFKNQNPEKAIKELEIAARKYS